MLLPMLPSLPMQTQGHCNDNIQGGTTIYTYISYIYTISMSVAGGAGVRAGGHIQAGAAAQWRLQGAR